MACLATGDDDPAHACGVGGSLRESHTASGMRCGKTLCTSWVGPIGPLQLNMAKSRGHPPRLFCLQLANDQKRLRAIAGVFRQDGSLQASQARRRKRTAIQPGSPSGSNGSPTTSMPAVRRSTSRSIIGTGGHQRATYKPSPSGTMLSGSTGSILCRMSLTVINMLMCGSFPFYTGLRYITVFLVTNFAAKAWFSGPQARIGVYIIQAKIGQCTEVQL